jgi:hypothetical protein
MFQPCFAESRTAPISGPIKASLADEMRRPTFAGPAADQLKAAASKLEQSRTSPAAVTARNPSETKSWLRMMHLPLSIDDHPILLKISESPRRQTDAAGPGTIALVGVRQKNAGAEKCENCRYRFDHRRCPLEPRRHNTTCKAAQSKRFRALAGIGSRLMISGNRYRGGPCAGLRTAASASPKQSS